MKKFDIVIAAGLASDSVLNKDETAGRFTKLTCSPFWFSLGEKRAMSRAVFIEMLRPFVVSLLNKEKSFFHKYKLKEDGKLYCDGKAISWADIEEAYDYEKQAAAVPSYAAAPRRVITVSKFIAEIAANNYAYSCPTCIGLDREVVDACLEVLRQGKVLDGEVLKSFQMVAEAW